jgi:hypothetical protein
VALSGVAHADFKDSNSSEDALNVFDGAATELFGRQYL